ncbi:sugar phosphate isomerase/epimerase [Treponema sp.]
MRRIGIFYAYWSREWEADFMPFVEKVGKLGFEQLELHAAAVAKMGMSERKKIKDAASAHNLKLSYGIGLTKDHDPSALDENARKAGVAFMKKAIEGVAEMGGGMIGGTVHSYWPALPPKDLKEKAAIRAQSIKSMKELAPIARDSGVILNVEVINRFEQFMLNTCEEALSFVKEVDSPALGILLDTFHMNIEEDSIGDAIRMAGKHLNSLHIGETNRKLPGMGRMPWAEIKTALDDINYDGPLVMEPFIVPGGQIGKDIALWRELVPNPDLDALAAKSVEFVKKTLR